MDAGRRSTWRYVTAIGFTMVCAWWSFHLHERPPGVTYMDIAVHEIGHILFRPFGELWMLLMGSGTQIAFPLGLAAWFLLIRGDLLSGAVLLSWAGEACADAATYVADAPHGTLPLLGGGGEGDWTRILGPEHLSRMHMAATYASWLRGVAAVLMIVAVATSVYAIARSRSTTSRETGMPASTLT